MNEQIKDSNEIQIDTRPLEKLVDVSDIHLNVSQKMIITTEDKVHLCLLKHLNQIGRKGGWIAPLGIFIAIGATLVTSSFKENVLLLSADTWHAIFIIIGILSFVWFVWFSIRALMSKKIDFVEELKKGSHFDTKQMEKGHIPRVEISRGKSEGVVKIDTTRKRVDRILSVWDARAASILGPSWSGGPGENKVDYRVPSPPRNFEFYYIGKKPSVDYSIVISVHDSNFNLESDLADIRVMVSQYQNAGNMVFKFVIAADLDLNKDKVKINDFFKNALQKVKGQEYFKIEVWDKEELLKIEKELGLKM